MGKIVISTNVSLDGVRQDPDGKEGFDRGGWFAPVGSTDRDGWAEVELDEALAASALLLGRRSYDWFAARWACRPGEWADRLRGLPKYVVSSTLADEAATWGPTTILRGTVVDQVSALKRERDGDILVYASYQLGQALMEHDLVDELRLFLHPVVLGAGERLFGATSATKPMRLVSARTVGEGLTFLTYGAV
jgi:dihydrofolate reductase